ncbi:F-box and WD repeat domain containing protein 10B [Gadus chalcogrammus]|uniref:F-box and WD repeat domain containing protein 10B n=1 Tax=Gadus chalcogrammus TaxID=1042646 RepID=UPI0024C4D58B|nr:F-box and WD repeat domain containing protein 10B [Gadus chalcogrammus]
MIEFKNSMSAKSGGFRCKMKGAEEGFTFCGTCTSCRFTTKLTDSTRWLSRAGQSTKRTFLIGLLVRCKSVPVLESIRDVLQVTFGKDFTYSRSKRPSLADDVMTLSSNRALDRKLFSADVVETLNWFSCSQDWIKSSYLLSVLSLCDTGLLHMLANLNDVLLAREQRACLLRNATEVDSIPDCASSFCSEDRPHLDLLRQAGSMFEPVSLCEDKNDAKRPTCLISTSFEPTIREPARRKGAWVRKGTPWEDPGSDGEDPALMVTPRSSAALSGVGRYRDFLRCLPVHLAKRILGLTDKLTLRCCRDVSQHWRYLADDLVLDQNAKKVVRNQVLIIQSNRNKKVLSDVYANVLEVLVPIGTDEDEDVPSEVHEGELFRGAYSGLRTKAVQMEERNVYCGLFSVTTLLEKEDPHRFVHYGGGSLVAMGSKDRVVRLLSIASRKEVAPALRGHVGSVRTVLLCEDRDLVISAGYDLTIRCWSMKTSVCWMLLSGHTGTVTCLDVHSDHLVSGAKDCRVKVWDLQKGKCLETLRWKHTSPVQCVRVFLSLVYSSCAKGLVKIWDIEKASVLRVLDAHTSAVKCLFFDRWHLLSGDADGKVMAWSTHRDATKCLMTFTHPMEVRSLALAYLRVVTGCEDGKMRVFSLLNGDCLRVIKAGSKLNPILSVHFHGNNVLVNTKSSLLLFQFVKVGWEYQSAGLSSPSSEALALSGARVALLPGSAPSRIPHDFVRAERMALVGSPCRGIYGPDGERSERAALSHHARCLSTGRMRRARESQQESLRPCSWSDLRSHRRSRAYQDLQPEFRTPPPSAISPGRPASGRGAESAWTQRHTSKGREFGTPAKTDGAVNASERAASDRSKKRGPSHRLTTDRILLKVNAIQQAHGGGGEAALHTGPNARPRNGAKTPAFRPPPVLGQQNPRFGGRAQNSPMASGDKDREDRAKASRTRAHFDAGAQHRCHADSSPAGPHQAGRHLGERERPHTAVAEKRATRLRRRKIRNAT